MPLVSCSIASVRVSYNLDVWPTTNGVHLYRQVLVVSQGCGYQAWLVLYREYTETDPVSPQQGDLMPFFRAAGVVMAIVYLTVSYVR